MNPVHALTLALTGILMASAAASLAQPALSAVRVDVLDRRFPDVQPMAAAFTELVSVPRGGSVAFLAA